MNIGILGYGKEGQSAERYFAKYGHKVTVFDHFKPEDLDKFDFNGLDLIFRSPSVHPQANFSSVTRYFFDHCPCPIIGVTGTKGKGTTCSIITDLLKRLQKDVHLVGNIGIPSINILDQLTPKSIVVYELSSFQLWDLEKSPHVAVILPIEPDHLNIHDDYADYLNAKAHICQYQTPSDFCIYYQGNPDSTQIATRSPARQLPYPVQDRTHLDSLLAQLSIPGQHNRDNAEAALLAAASILNLSINQFITKYPDQIIQTFKNFHTLPHRLEFVRELNHVKYYDDNFSTTPTSLDVALKAFPDQTIILIAGGRDKTNDQDLPDIATLIQNSTVAKTILIGESGRKLANLLPNSEFAADLPSAVQLARTSAELLGAQIVLMSPSAASFDMFDNVYDRGAQYQKLVQELR